MGIYNNIVCAIDLSPSSESTCSRAIMLAQLYGASLTLLHVVEHFPQDRSNELIAPEYTDPAKYREGQARAGLTELASRLGFSDATIDVLFSTQSAWHEIVRFAEDRNADLLITGSHGSHGISTLLGSTANSIVNQAPCDVLAVRAKA